MELMLSRILRIGLFALMPGFLLTACNVEETPVEPLRVLGEPPGTAVIGAEYFYEWAVDGGKGIPDFTLTNAPRWLSVEWVENKFRRGIVMRGIPGITGGRHGTGDLTQDTDDTTIVLSVTDGDQLVTKSFTIGVPKNLIKGVSSEVDEDTDMERPADEDGKPIPVCESDDAGTWNSEQGDPPAVPDGMTLAYVLATLDAAPVEPVVFHFQPVSATSSGATPGVDYVEREGYLTFRAGMTRCLIAAFVKKDTEAEPNEIFSYEFDRVVSGLGDVTEKENQAVPKVSVTILDDEPRVDFDQAVISSTEGKTVTVTARLNKAPEVAASATFTVVDGETTADSNDYEILGASGNTVNFNPGETEKTFTIELKLTDDSDKDADEKLTLRWDACKSSEVRTACAGDTMPSMTLWINEWLAPVSVNLPPDSSMGERGVFADAAVDDWGRVYVAYNYTRSNGHQAGEVRVYDRTGVNLLQTIPFASGDDRFDARIGAIRLQTQSGTGKPAQVLYIVGSANGRFTSVPSGSAPALGGWDAVAERWERADVNAPLVVNWRVQYGSDQDDYANSLAITTGGELYVVGDTDGAVENDSNLGGRDGFVLFLSETGQFRYAINTGTTGADHIASARIGSSSAVDFAGSAVGEYDDLPQGGRDAITGSYNTEGRVVRKDQFGSPLTDEILALGKLSTGYVSAGYTTGSLFEGKLGFGGEDIMLAYHKTLSFPDKKIQLGTAANDRALASAGRDLYAFVGGETGGSLVAGTSVVDGKDGWFARYEAKPEDKDLIQTWIRQTAQPGADRIVSLLPTAQNKVFVVDEVEGDAGNSLIIWPITPEGEDLVVP